MIIYYIFQPIHEKLLVDAKKYGHDIQLHCFDKSIYSLVGEIIKEV